MNSPIPSIRTPFTQDGEIDFDGVRARVDFLIDGNATTPMLTWGDSLHSVLTDNEVAELARVVVGHTRGRAKVIAVDNGWPTRKAVEYGEYCKQMGADLLMLMPPDWAGCTTQGTLVKHFNAVGKHLPVMFVTAFFKQSGLFGAGPGRFICHACSLTAGNFLNKCNLPYPMIQCDKALDYGARAPGLEACQVVRSIGSAQPSGAGTCRPGNSRAGRFGRVVC